MNMPQNNITSNAYNLLFTIYRIGIHLAMQLWKSTPGSLTLQQSGP